MTKHNTRGIKEHKDTTSKTHTDIQMKAREEEGRGEWARGGEQWG